MTDMQSPQRPLEVLPAMLNLVLLQTAKILRDPECHNSKQSGLTRRRITEIVTVANQRFHDALDEIEVETLRAKAVMERDLRLVRKQRAERDHANDMIVDPSPPKEPDEAAPNHTTGQAVNLLSTTNGEQLLESALPARETTDAAAEDLKTHDEAAPENTDQEAINNELGMPQDSENPMGLAITIPSDDVPKAAEQSQLPVDPAEALVSTEAPLEIAEGVDLDFESMFNDTDPKAIDDALNFDFGLSTDPALAQDILNDTSFNEISISNTDIGNIPATTNEDIDSLLPGVENYLNADTDFSNITIPPANTLPDTSQLPIISSTSAPAQGLTEPAAVETSFDESFFGLGNFDMGETGGDELGDGTLGDFEDFDWT